MIKNTKEQIEDINKNIANIKAFSDKISLLNTTDKDKFWSALKATIEKSIENAKTRMINKIGENSSNNPGGDLANIKFIAGVIEGYESIIEIVDRTEDNLAKASVNIKELERVREELKNNVDLQA